MLMRFLLALVMAFGGLASAQAAFRVPTAQDLHGQWVTVAQVLDGGTLRWVNRASNAFFTARAAFEFRSDGGFLFTSAIAGSDGLAYPDEIMWWFAQPRPATLTYAGPDRTGFVQVSGTPQNPGPGYAFQTALATTDTELRGLGLPVKRGELVLTFVNTEADARRMNVERQYMIRVMRRVDLQNLRNLPQQIPVIVLPGN